MTREEIAKVLAVCSAAYPHVVITKETAIVYAESLRDLPFDPVSRAVRKLVTTSEFFPTIAKIRRAVAEADGKLPPDGATAYGEVISAAASRGALDRPEWSHPAVNEVVEALGWSRICRDDNPAALRAQFMRVYEPIRDRHDRAIVGLPDRILSPHEALRTAPPHQESGPHGLPPPPKD